MRFSGYAGATRYSIDGDPARLKLGSTPMRGAMALDPELAQRAFKAGEGVLMLEGGRQLRLIMLGHTAGGADVFFEARV